MPPNKRITAGIYDTRYGQELRLHDRRDENNVIDSLLSRTDDGPLEHRAGGLRAALDQQGWRAAR